MMTEVEFLVELVMMKPVTLRVEIWPDGRC